MEQIVLAAQPREDKGKGAARQLRRDGFIPAVAYGQGRDAVKLTISRESLERILHKHVGGNVVFDLQIEGYSDPQGTAALIKSMQRHPLSRIPESVDFQWISLREKVNVMVPVHLEGSSQAQADGAVIDQILHEVEVACMPLSIPERLVLSIDGMELHETRTVSQLVLPEGIEVLAEANAPVATCIPPAQMVAEHAEEGVEGEIESVEEARGGTEASEGSE